MKLFTFLPLSEISRLMKLHSADPGKRVAQHALAFEVLCLVHGEEEAKATAAQHKSMRKPTLSSIASAAAPAKTEQLNSTSAPSTRVYIPRSLFQNTPISKVLYHAGIAPSRSEANKLINKGGAYVGSTSADNLGDEISFVPIKSSSSLADEYEKGSNVLVLRSGKWKVKIVEVLDDVDFDKRGLDCPGWNEWKAKAYGEQEEKVSTA